MLETSIMISFFLILAFSSFAHCQDLIGCFVNGECTNSLFVDVSVQQSPKDCLQFCKETSDCNYFTHFNDTETCFAFTNCVVLNNLHCNDCTSGDVTCILDESCFEPGFCTGNLIFGTKTANAIECLRLCQEEANCLWFSFDNGFCALTSDCLLLNDCTDCVHGQSSCSVDIPNVLVIGGDTSEGIANSSELISPNSSTNSCPGLPNFPIATRESFLIRKNTGEPMVCGGFSNRKCCSYLKDGYWIQTNDTLSGNGIYSPAVIDIGNGEYWIVGGDTSNAISHYYKNGEFQKGPDIPYTWTGHCGLKINETHYFFTGSYLGTADPYLYDNSTETFESLSTGGLTFGTNPSCGIVKDGQEIVVAGGFSNGYLSSVHILDLSTFTWRSGPSLAEPRANSASLPWEDSFIIIGGTSNSEGSFLYYDDIVFFDAEQQEWIEMPGKMEIARLDTAAMLVSREEIGC